GAMAARKMLQQGRDPLLELNSCDAGQAAFTVGAVSDATRTLELADYMDRVFDYFGVELQPHGALSVIVHPGDHMLCHSFPGLPEGGITGTYDRSEALSHEDMHFLTWEHPMVTGAMDMMIAGEFGNATLCALKAPYLKPGTLILEAIFVVNCTAPRWLQLRRYIPRGTIRVVVDRQQKDVSEILTSERINASVQHMKARIATEVAKHARGEITKMAERAAEIAQHQLAPMIEAAERNIDHEQGAELDRLQALAAVNQNIRPEEIAYRKQCAVELLAHLANTQLKLDAVRVGLAT
ncbi:MAG: RNA polymerase-associated protein RapA, partial [Gammaproteobacteria bacterium]|nr:RNA polymerase-associated protein RapA [Gammaproteobacteria bacterium]